jgi:hypothetical protein
LKHQWLFLNTLDTIATVRRLVSFYVLEHNTRLPHSALAYGFEGHRSSSRFGVRRWLLVERR